MPPKPSTGLYGPIGDFMSIKEFIINWMFKNVRISTLRLKAIVDNSDTNHDGYIDVAEFVNTVREYVKEVKE